MQSITISKKNIINSHTLTSHMKRYTPKRVRKHNFTHTNKKKNHPTSHIKQYTPKQRL
jgi:hypothetical protein